MAHPSSDGPARDPLSTTTSAATTPSPSPSSALRQSSTFGRWLVRAFLSLWWLFIAILAAGLVSYLGNHNGPTPLPALAQMVTWARQQPLPVQVGLALAWLAHFAVMGWLTFLAWRLRSHRTMDDEYARVAAEVDALPATVEQVLTSKQDLLMGTRILEYDQRDIGTHATSDSGGDVGGSGGKDDGGKRTGGNGDDDKGWEQEEARRRAEQALAISEERGDRSGAANALRDLGVLAVEQGQPAAARGYFEKALANYREVGNRSAEGSILTELGRLASYLGQPQEARRCFEQALVIAREVGDRRSEGAALSHLGTLVTEQGQPEEAGRYFEQALYLARDEGDRQVEGAILSKLGQVARAQGRLEEARVYFQQALVIAREVQDLSSEGEDLSILAQLAKQLGRLEEAEADFQQSLMIAREIGNRQDEVLDLLDLADLALQQGKLATVRDITDRALSIARDLGDVRVESRVYMHLGDASVQRHAWTTALEEYQHALALNPEEAAIWRKQGLVLMQLARYHEALAAFEHALALHPGDPAAFANEGNALAALGRREEALVAYERALTQHPVDADVLTNQGLVLRRLGRPQEALDAYERALSINPMDAGVWVRRGELLSELGRPVEALDAYERALSINPMDAGVWVRRGNLFSQLGRPEVAAMMYERARELDPPSVESTPPEEPDSGEDRPVTKESRPEPSASGEPAKEPVHFTAFHPLIVAPERMYSLVVYTHVPTAKVSVRADVTRFRDVMPGIVNEVGVPAAQPIARRTRIRIAPECEGVTFNPEEVSFRWFEDQQRSEFRFMADQAYLGRGLKGEIAVYVGPLQIASLDFTLVCKTSEEVDALEERTAKEEGKLYETVFASYSHLDTEIALACRNAYIALGLHVDIDLDSLRTGDKFADKLMELIRKADAFQLFWSHNSAESEWVEREWQYALGLQRGIEFIRPVCWERPPVPAPAPLSNLHFKYVPLARLVGSEDDPYTSGRASSPSAAEPQPPPAETQPSEPVPVVQPVQTSSQVDTDEHRPAAGEQPAQGPQAVASRRRRRFWPRSRN